MKSVYDRLHVHLLNQEVIHADETTAQVLHEDGKTPESKSYIWLYTSGAFEKHRIVKDVTRCGCWAHLRRYMFEAVPKKTKDTTQSPALTGLAYCDRLFDIERELADFTPDE